MPRPLASDRRDGDPSTPDPGPGPRWSGMVNRWATLAMLSLLTVLLVGVLFEAWIQELLGDRTVNEVGLLVGYIPEWPKTLKNGLVIALVLLSALKVSLERRWREFRTRADLALMVLAAIMIISGLLGTSGPVLIGEAIFVYLRGAAVFYAVRALHPSREQVRRVLWIIGPVIGLNILVAAVQMFVGRPAYTALGWVDLAWADTNRAHGLLDHPNQLGHVLGLVLIGLIAWMSGLPAVARWWWVALGVAALGLAGTQSRESVLGVLAAAALIWFLRRRGGRTILVSATLITVLFGGYLLARPDNFREFAARVVGVFSAVETPPGTEDCEGFETNAECVDAGRVEKREIRMLFYQQGARLLAERPILGYGVGQFGGIVAEKHDPNWEQDPRFPGGFDLYDFDGTTVDSFWLHLVIEVGVLGLLAYLAWLWLLSVPLLGVTPRLAGQRIWGGPRPRAPADGGATSERASQRGTSAERSGAERTYGSAAALCGVGVVLFGVIIGFFAPALEDALYPILSFAIIGVAWVSAQQARTEPLADSGL